MVDMNKRGKIMVVDDEPVNVELISGYLENEYDIIAAYNGKEALLKLGTEKPDIVLLDIMMPDMDGYEVCQRIKEQDSTRFTPVVMVTALGELEAKIRAINSGADDFLTKPINNIELTTRVRSLIKAKYYHDQLINSKEKIEAQNEFRTIMTNILPLILQSIPPERIAEVMGQMSRQVEDVIWSKYINKLPENITQTANISCSLLNRLGGEFSVEEIKDKSYDIKNIKCPWGEHVINPVLCMMTKAIMARIGIHVYKDVNVDIKKTIAGGDGYCLIKIYMG